MILNQHLFCTILLGLISSVSSYAQNWQWARQVGNSSFMWSEYGEAITDGSNNSYLIGRFGGTLYLQSDTLNAVGNNDMFIIKYNTAGNEVWCKRLGGNNGNNETEEIRGVFDPVSNSLYVAGRFYHSMYLSPSITLNGSGGSELFIAKLDLDGNYIWAKSAGGSTGNENAYVFAEPDGDILLAGKLASAGYFDSIAVAAGGFLARYNSNGSCEWAQNKFSGPENFKLSVAFLGADIIFSGLTSQFTQIDTASFSPQGSDGFVSRLDSMGNIKWNKLFSGTSSDGILGVVVDNSINSIFVSGYYTDSMNVDGQAFQNPVRDWFVAKLSANGILTWKETGATTGTGGYAQDISLDPDGNLLVTGSFSGSSTFGSTSLTADSPSDSFFAKMNSSGLFLSAINVGEASSFSIASDNIGSAIVCGVFPGNLTLGNSSFSSFGGNDIFIGKVDLLNSVLPFKNIDPLSLIIYPNPSNEFIKVGIPEEILSEAVQLSITDLNGRLITEQMVTPLSRSVDLDLSELAPSLYIIAVTAEGNRYFGKFVKEWVTTQRALITQRLTTCFGF